IERCPPPLCRRLRPLPAAGFPAVVPPRAQTAGPAPAAPAAPPAYAMSVWSSEKGLPPGDGFAVNQDAEGSLWLGTPTGLLRFDGSQFVSWATLNSKEPLPAGP